MRPYAAGERGPARRPAARRHPARPSVDQAGPRQVSQLDFPEFDTGGGGTWRIAACSGFWSKDDVSRRFSLTAQHHATAAVNRAITTSACQAGRPRLQAVRVPVTGQVRPVIIVTDDDDGPHRSARCAATIR